MSKLLEYMSLIPKAIPNAFEIIEGIRNNVKAENGHLPEDKQLEITKRRIICASCPFNSENAKVSKEYENLVGKSYVSDRNDVHCAFCGCPVNIRTASLKKECGAESWNKDNPNKQITLKWNSYEQ